MFKSLAREAALSRENQLPYSDDALRQDLHRMQIAWMRFQEDRTRDAVYGYLSAVHDVASWWIAAGAAERYALRALRLSRLEPPDVVDPFAAIILCTSDTAKVDKQTRSKWSRTLRFAGENKDLIEALGPFIRRCGGINRCASLAKHLRRKSQ